ncbi:GTPase IMAP family member GIMD1-like [Cheilinus undulatus]|uniref:GTPase IMAP family member GIMD1-like n=1 Tax=Cheilinus undulatus TaxID=241271 RepID=UPI001BD4F798|nr:GTPase IMAP family member GIMD1-like [Cheilinus undulatus]
MSHAGEHGCHDDVCSRIIGSLGRRCDEERNVLALNVLLLGRRQSGRSSVGNALIGGEEFQTRPYLSGVSTTTECKLLSRTFRNFFRRQGAESDLLLRVLDTPQLTLRPHTLHQLCPEGVHVLVLIIRADQSHEDAHLEEQAQSLLGQDWRRHSLLVLTFTDHLKKAGLQPSDYLALSPDWLKALTEEVEGGAFFMDNSCDWASIRGGPLRERLLRLSARNHHKALTVQTEVSL